MNRRLTKVLKSEKGQALVVVLILMVLGGLLIVPCLNYTATSLNTGQVHKETMALIYAADAGVGDALWGIKNETVPINPFDYETEFSYFLPEEVNGKAVEVKIQQVWPLSGLESDANGTNPSSHLMITGGIINEEEGEYKVQMSYDGSAGDLLIDRVGVWLPPGFDYVTGSSSGITTDDPTNILDWHGGKALEWDFLPAVNFIDLPAPAPPEPPPEGGFVPAEEYPSLRTLTFNVSPVGELAKGTYTWIRTTNINLYLSWDTNYSTYKISSTATDAATSKRFAVESYSYRSKGSLFGGGGDILFRGGYRAIGQTLETYSGPPGPAPKRDVLLEESSATTSGILGDAEVVWAYLYWSASRERECIDWWWWWCQEWEEAEADKEVSFKVNGQQVYFDEDEQAALAENDEQITATKWWIKDNSDIYAHTYSYSCFLDVTELVKLGLETTTPGTTNGNGEYTVGDVDGTLGLETSYAGWSLIIIYSSPSELAQNLYLYDDFLFAGQYTTHTFTIEGFQAPEDAEAKLTCFVGEGDPQYGDHQKSTYGHPLSDDEDYITFNDNYLFELPVNPQYNVWNSESSGLGGEEISGVDIDTFDVSSPIIQPGATWAEVGLGTGYDVWSMVYIILSFRSNIPGGLAPNSIGSITYSCGGGS